MNEILGDEYALIAIHCSAEAFKMAFYLNKYAGLRLQRRRRDLDFSKNGLDVLFPIFEYENVERYTTFNLLANKCTSVTAHITATGGFFNLGLPEETIVSHVVPEYAKVDFFLKITSEQETNPVRQYLAKILDIKQVISAYEVPLESLRSKHNLIFD